MWLASHQLGGIVVPDFAIGLLRDEGARPLPLDERERIIKEERPGVDEASNKLPEASQ